MNKVIFGIMLFFIVGSMACQSFRSVKPEIAPLELPQECKDLAFLIKGNWKKHRTLNYYKSDGDFLTIIQRDYRDCITSLNRTETIKLFGEPAENNSNYTFYFLNQTCLDTSPQNCQTLIFYFYKETDKVFDYLLQPYGYFSHHKIDD